MSPESVLTALDWRYATKKFDPTRIIDEPTWQALEQAALLAPSCFGLHATRIVVVTNPEVRTRLRAVGNGQPQITEASHLVVFARRLDFTTADADAHIARVAEVRDLPVESLAGLQKALYAVATDPTRLAGGNVDTWARAQTYLALGFFLSAAANLGVDACPMEGFNPAGFDEVLGLRADGYSASVIAAAGYRTGDDRFATLKKVRMPPSVTLRRV